MIVLERVSRQFEGRRRVTALVDINLQIGKGEPVLVDMPARSSPSGSRNRRRRT
jgi:hypothetical protein